MGERPKERRTRPATEASLREAALRYLSQRDASRARLRRALVRRVDRAVKAHAQDRDELLRVVEGILDDFTRLGYLDDARYAAQKTRALRARGGSKRAIASKLREHGVDAALVAEQLDDQGTDDELAAALRHLKKRRHGPFRREGVEPNRDKELASLGRAGFSYEIAARAWSTPREDAEAILAR